MFILTGCVAPSQWHRYANASLTAPPAPLAEVMDNAPAVDCYWVGGDWRSDGLLFRWIAGRWVKPRANEAYVQGGWHYHRGLWHHVSPHWHRVIDESINTVDVPDAPPMPTREVATEPAAPDVFWISGGWTWDRGRYTWVPGRWETVRAGYVWAPAQWLRGTAGWSHLEGHWEPSSNSSGSAAYE